MLGAGITIMVKIGMLPDLENCTEYKGKLQYTMKEDNKRPKPRNIILAEKLEDL